ncbi:MAG: A/G-specific adenine glycosylase [Bacteroidota bacterium]
MSTGQDIIDWYHQYGRRLPWRDTYDPYQIWIAEVILQQTRIEQGIKYFYRFIERFPSVAELAEAEQDEVLKYWEGLGYYSRARNLHAAAKQIQTEFEGSFPQHYTTLEKLKGVGPYTSRAIGSFAFGNNAGVIDGNVLRVVSRFLGDHSPINDVKTRKKFQQVVDEWVDGKDSRAFNHGMMDIGATICSPKKPACLICPLQASCVAFKDGLTHILPYKPKKLKRKARYLNFYLVSPEIKQVMIRQRDTEGLWGGLWEIPNEEVEQESWLSKKDPLGGTYQMEFKHVLTHLDLMIHVYKLESIPNRNWGKTSFIATEEIPNFAFSKAVLKIFDKTLY